MADNSQYKKKSREAVSSTRAGYSTSAIFYDIQKNDVPVLLRINCLYMQSTLNSKVSLYMLTLILQIEWHYLL